MESFAVKTDSQAPALERGVRILQLLSASEPMSLEQIAGALHIPKASALRFLATLEQMHMVTRHADKSYSALYSLRPIVDYKTSFLETLEGRMVKLVAVTGCTVEWYEAAVSGMQLVQQQNPDSELCVKARPGYLRQWGEEFEAVTRLGYAFASDAPKAGASQIYQTNGVLTELTKQEVLSMIRSVKAQRYAIDEAFNVNGVRRVAIAKFDEGQDFIGVLALAQSFRFTKLSDTQSLLSQLAKI